VPASSPSRGCDGPLSVAAVEIVFAEIIDGFPQALDSVIGTAIGVGFYAFASALQHKYFGAEVRAKVHGAHGFLHRVD